MRLLEYDEAGEIRLAPSSVNNLPQYAILSHTWGTVSEEVSFKEMVESADKGKPGYKKIQFCGDQARRDSLRFFWVDTCCIDKSSSSELQEAINSMFGWYKDAAVCHVFLTDLPPDSPALASCRWFTRGWTLQELLAPRKVEFYDAAWNHIGSKLDLIDAISTATRIPKNVLSGRKTLPACSVSMRMSWSASRQTTRTEDIAYCLLGIFDVKMPLIYGEGRESFRRLQEEIIKHNADLTIFAWDSPQRGLADQEFLSIFSPSPAAFSSSSSVRPFDDDFAEFSVTNKGIMFSGDLPLRLLAWSGRDGHCDIYGLFLGGNDDRRGGLFLRKVGPGLFCRDGRFPLAGFWNMADTYQTSMLENVPKFHVLTDVSVAHRAFSAYRKLALHIPFDKAFELADAVPESLWDITDRLFLMPKTYSWCRYPIALAVSLHLRLLTTKLQIVVLCDYRHKIPVLRIFELSRYSRATEIIFGGAHREMSIAISELEDQEPELSVLKDQVDIITGSKVIRVTVSAVQDTLRMAEDIPIFSLAFKVSELSANAS